MAKDLFSSQSDAYARFRPTYPEELIEYITSFCTEKETAWDCATGNGQAAALLSPYFKKVIATDISKGQIEKAIQKENIEYNVCSAETTQFKENTFDLITVAQAYHWLQWESFRNEAIRVCKNGAVIAVWMYNLPSTGDNAVDNLLKDFYTNIAGPYWDKERRFVDENYTTVSFDFEILPAKDFEIKTEWNREHFLGYLSSWSATKNFETANGYSPLNKIESPLKTLWKTDEIKSISFPIILKLGRIVK